MKKDAIFMCLPYDGYNVGLVKSFSSTYLEFEDLELALRIMKHWARWVRKK